MSGINGAGMKRIGNRLPSSQNDGLKYKSLVVNLLVGALCFYAGIGVGIRVDVLDCTDKCAKQQENSQLLQSAPGGGGGERILKSEMDAICEQKVQSICGGEQGATKKKTEADASQSAGNRFPDNVRYFATGVSTIVLLLKCCAIRAAYLHCLTSYFLSPAEILC